MSVRYLSTGAHTALRENITANQSAYLSGQADKLLTTLGKAAVHVSRIQGGEPPVLHTPDGNDPSTTFIFPRQRQL